MYCVFIVGTGVIWNTEQQELDRLQHPTIRAHNKTYNDIFSSGLQIK